MSISKVKFKAGLGECTHRRLGDYNSFVLLLLTGQLKMSKIFSFWHKNDLTSLNRRNANSESVMAASQDELKPPLCYISHSSQSRRAETLQSKSSVMAASQEELKPLQSKSLVVAASQDELKPLQSKS